MKKLINAPENALRESLLGLAAAHADLLRVQFDPHIVVRVGAPQPGKVGIVAGGGSGHEPLHTGYVGYGMLDAACSGEIFTSPTPDQIVAAANAVDSGAGVLLIVKNYTGDVLNFGIAAELLRADGMQVAEVIVNDDIALENPAQRRGVGAAVFVEKLCGAAAEAGCDLPTLTALAERVIANTRSMGIALTPCIVPTAGFPTFTLGDDEMEVGVGIHGEPGRWREALQPAQAITERLATLILDDLPFNPGDHVIIMVNGLGGTPLMELYIVYHTLAAHCAARQLNIQRRLVGNYITSLEMSGAALTMLRADDELLRWWDAPVHTPALRWGL